MGDAVDATPNASRRHGEEARLADAGQDDKQELAAQIANLEEELHLTREVDTAELVRLWALLGESAPAA